ncbi:hypothetical protein [Zavarzinella formosa]|uniref:hypothetical protein n=1 Tax=Zavarzinella formosa TaxID=360055 RepID=UPI00037521DA|nr:hypothetical protein [Zavarzinella formosa]
MTDLFRYPLSASDYLDISGFDGRGSVAGLVSDDGKIVMSYEAGFSFEQAKRVASYLNGKRPPASQNTVAALKSFKKIP